MTGYLMAGQSSEQDRLSLQSRVWEPAGERLLGEIAAGHATRAVDVGCGVLGWLRVLDRWVGDGGEIVGTDIDEALLALAGRVVEADGLQRVRLVRDDLFASELEPASFDLVHARFQLAPLGRAGEQLDAYLRLVRPGGVVVLEDPDTSSWHLNPAGPATAHLIELILEAFTAAGGDFDAGRAEPALLRERGLDPVVRAEVVALEPGHPYLALPLQFSRSLEPRLLGLVEAAQLAALRASCEEELSRPGCWGTTFTLVQTWARVGGASGHPGP